MTTLIFDISKGKYIDLLVKVTKRNQKVSPRLIFFIFMAIPCLAVYSIAFYRQAAQAYPLPISLWIFSILLLLGFIWMLSGLQGTKRRVRLDVKAQLKSGELDSQYFGRHTMIFYEDHYLHQYGTSEFKNNYAGIQEIVDMDTAIVIYFSRSSFDIISNSAFQSPEQRAAFLENLHMLKACVDMQTTVYAESTRHPEMRPDALQTISFSWNQADFANSMVSAMKMSLKTRNGIVHVVVGVAGAVCLLNALWNLLWLILGLATSLFTSPHSIAGLQFIVPFLFSLSCGVIFTMPIVMLLYKPLILRRVNKYFEKGVYHQDELCYQTMSLLMDRIFITTQNSEYCFKFQIIHQAQQNTHGVQIMTKTYRYLLIPETAFVSPEHKQAFYDCLTERIQAYKK